MRGRERGGGAREELLRKKKISPTTAFWLKRIFLFLSLSHLAASQARPKVGMDFSRKEKFVPVSSAPKRVGKKFVAKVVQGKKKS